MDFFKSVFSDPSPSPPSSPSSPMTPVDSSPQPETPSNPNPNPNPWAFGSTIFSAIASKSESLLDNYYKDIQEFSSGLKKETSAIRQAASRAVKELPSRLESGAAIAQESLEAVGQAIDNVGSSVVEIIGNDLNLASNSSFFGGHLNEVEESSKDGDNYGKDSGFTDISKPYSRIDALIRSLQCSVKTYCEEVEETDYIVWKAGFRLYEQSEEIERLINENGVIEEIYDEVVPKKVDEETFWCRYFYKVGKVIQAEEARARFVKKAISGEEEELSWDVDDDDKGSKNDDRHLEKNDPNESKDELSLKSSEKGVEKGHNDEAGVSGTKGEQFHGEEIVDERLKCDEKDGSEGKIESDFSVISSQRFDDDDIGWDEIEAFGSGDENKNSEHRSSSSSNATDLRKRLSAVELEEELNWDVE